MILTGKYVTLCPLVPDDAEITQKWRTGGRAKLLNRGAQTVEEQRAWIVGRPDNEYNFVQVLTETGQPVGMISLVDVDLVHRRAEPSHFLIGEEAAVKPYGSKVAFEAVKLIYQLAFDTLGLHRVYGPIAGDNTGMLTFHRYLGMREEGRLREHYWLNGKWQDAILIGMLESEYRTVALPKLNALLGVKETEGDK
jgi:RimJ/RimL family protein N-acetyltransferase